MNITSKNNCKWYCRFSCKVTWNAIFRITAFVGCITKMVDYPSAVVIEYILYWCSAVLLSWSVVEVFSTEGAFVLPGTYNTNSLQQLPRGASVGRDLQADWTENASVRHDGHWRQWPLWDRRHLPNIQPDSSIVIIDADSFQTVQQSLAKDNCHHYRQRHDWEEGLGCQIPHRSTATTGYVCFTRCTPSSASFRSRGWACFPQCATPFWGFSQAWPTPSLTRTSMYTTRP